MLVREPITGSQLWICFTVRRPTVCQFFFYRLRPQHTKTHLILRIMVAMNWTHFTDFHLGPRCLYVSVKEWSRMFAKRAGVWGLDTRKDQTVLLWSASPTKSQSIRVVSFVEIKPSLPFKIRCVFRFHDFGRDKYILTAKLQNMSTLLRIFENLISEKAERLPANFCFLANKQYPISYSIEPAYKNLSLLRTYWLKLLHSL